MLPQNCAATLVPRNGIAWIESPHRSAQLIRLSAHAAVSAKPSADRVLRRSLAARLQPGPHRALQCRPGGDCIGRRTQWFDLSGLFRSIGSDPRYHAALPGLLVGAGLLFTFLGLAAALASAGEVVAEGVDQARRNAALRDLLGAASVKFITSLAGLCFSIFYALYRKRELALTERAFSTFLGALEERLPFRSSAMPCWPRQMRFKKTICRVQRISTDFFVNLASTLERSFRHGSCSSTHRSARRGDREAVGLTNQNESR